MNYILVVDDEEDIRDIYEIVLRRAFPLDVVLADSATSAIRAINERGKPEIIISDLRMPDGDGQFLYKYLTDQEIVVPFVICSTDSIPSLKKKFPNIQGYIEKPQIIGPALQIVESVISRFEVAPLFAPIRISLLQRWGTTDFDLYMKLSESKFVKVINAGEAFMQADVDRFSSKDLTHLYITTEDADTYLQNFEKNLQTMAASHDIPSNELSVVSLESLQSVAKLAACLGWTPQVIEVAKHAVNLSIQAVAAEPVLLKIFKQKMSNPQSRYAAHVSYLAIINCGICYQLGWTSESTQMKLGMASLMHDIALDETFYEDINLWNEKALDSRNKDAEVVKYRNHPIDAAHLLYSVKNLPSDVDQIILQHHEAKNGVGFPRGLTTTRISPMATVFIIVEDLINFIGESTDVEAKVKEFLINRESLYDSGNFKKVFDAIKDDVTKSRH